MKTSPKTHLSLFIITRLVMNTMLRMVYPYRGAFARGLGVDDRAISVALSLRSVVGMFSPLLAFISDRRGRKVGILLGLGMFTLGAGLISVWPVYPIFVITLSLTMLGNLVFIPAMQSYLSDRVAYQKRGSVLALTELAWGLSFILGVPLMGLLISQAGWKAPFPVLGILSLVIIILMVKLLDYDRPDKQAWRGLFSSFKVVFTFLPALAGLVMGLAMSSANETVNAVFALWMEDAFQVKLVTLAAASVVIGLAELGGESLVIRLVDRLGKPLAVALGLISNCLAVLLLPFIGNSLAGALTGLFFFYLSFEFTIVSSIPLMTEVLPAARATMMACFIASISAGRALGALLSIPLYQGGTVANPTFSILAVAVGATSMNLIALAALAYLRAHLKHI